MMVMIITDLLVLLSRDHNGVRPRPIYKKERKTYKRLTRTTVKEKKKPKYEEIPLEEVDNEVAFDAFVKTQKRLEQERQKAKEKKKPKK